MTDYLNKKPFRTAEQKEQARRSAKKVDGYYVSNAPYSVRTPTGIKIIGGNKKDDDD